MTKVPYMDLSVEQLEILLDNKSFEAIDTIHKYLSSMFMAQKNLVGLVDHDYKTQLMQEIIASVDITDKFAQKLPSGLYVVEGASIGLFSDHESGAHVRLTEPGVFRDYFLPNHEFIPVYTMDIFKVKK